MNRWIKYAALPALGLVALAAATLLVGAQLGERKMQRRIDVKVAPVALRDDADSIARGRYVFMSRGCTECHGVDGAGKTFVDDGKGMLVHAPNITPLPGGVVAAYTADDWTRTIRHGVKPDGRPAAVMPSEDYARMNDHDLASLVAFLRQMPARPGSGATVQFPMPVKALYAFGVVKDAAERIDHTLPPSPVAPDAPTAAHGAYLVNSCIGCHGANLSGGKIPGAPPDWPAAANLTPGDGSAMARYTDADSFKAMLRTGKRPDGSAVSAVMPFGALKELNDVDTQALYLHLKTLAPKASGNR
jgi:mono/diheme cytochrome c family protein